MTTIVGIQGDGYVVVAADTRISSLDDSGNAYQISTLGSGTAKIALNGKYLLGAAGDMRAINLLHHAFQPPMPTAGMKGKRLDSFMTTKFIPALRSCFETNGYSSSSNNNNSTLAEQDSSVIVVVNSTIYIIESDYSWTPEASGLYATGTGAPYALGALQVLAAGKKLSPAQAKSALLKSLQVSAKFDPYTGSPFNTYVQEIEKTK